MDHISSQQGNSVSTPLVKTAYKLHCLFFRHVYPYPLDIQFENRKISIKVNPILCFKYIPFFTALILITSIIGFGSCAFLPLFKLFTRSPKIDVIAIVLCVFLGSCAILEWSTYLVYCNCTEIEPLVNQLFEIERKCKLSIKTIKIYFLRFYF